MNLRAYIASTPCALVGMALAGAQPVGTNSPAASVDCGLATNAFARTASGNSITVKVARKAGVWVSREGSNWVHYATGTRCLLYDVAFGKGSFVAVGNEGTLLTSSNGVAWVPRNAQTDERLRGIAFGSGRFVAVGYAGTVITSKDGIRWKPSRSGTQERLHLVRYDSGKFVVVSYKGAMLISRNGSRWKPSKLATVKLVDASLHDLIIVATNRSTTISATGAKQSP